MVQAILAGQKTQTRRAVDERQRVGYPHCEIESALVSGFTTTGAIHFAWACPYGQPGDRLWVRETWALEDCGADGKRVVWQADRAARWVGDGDETVDSEVYYLQSDYNPGRWRPSIHIPRKHSRLTLEVTDVRVQRLQDISEEDARAEGVQAAPFCKAGRPDGMEHVEAFEDLWQRINSKRPGCSWDANPLVWAISFKVLP